jgi:hypothetical protein
MISVELNEDAAIGAEERLVCRGGIEDALVHASQKHLWISAGLPPDLPVQHIEQSARRPVPAEPEVGTELLESGDFFWKFG